MSLKKPTIRHASVEDLVLEATIQLKEKSSATKFEITAENFESIHNHNAWAQVTSDDLF